MSSARNPIPCISSSYCRGRWWWCCRILAPALRDNNSASGEQQASLQDDEPKTRTIGVQSVYRETEAQTDPFSPVSSSSSLDGDGDDDGDGGCAQEYVLDPDRATPEVLRLGQLSYGAGSLPVGLEEVEQIEREQEQRAFEESLPEIRSQADLERRRELLQERELHEWQQRERQIIEMEKARLSLIMNAIREREALNETRMHERLQHLRRQKEKECDDELLNVQKKRIKGEQAPPSNGSGPHERRSAEEGVAPTQRRQ